MKNIFRLFFVVRNLIVTITFIVLLLSNSYAKEQLDNEDDYSYNYPTNNSKCIIYDPYEKFNRKIFFFNGVVDTVILRPVAKMYGLFTNNYIKNRTGTLLSNISEPLTTVNYIIQGNSEGFFKSFWRFTINAVFGIGGLFDVASKVGLTTQKQTFSNSLAHYGVGPGPYIVLPLLGGMSARDLSEPITNSPFNPLKYAFHPSFKDGLTMANIIHSRHLIMPFTDYVTENSPDPYIAIRNAILEQKEANMLYSEGFKCPVVK